MGRAAETAGLSGKTRRLINAALGVGEHIIDTGVGLRGTIVVTDKRALVVVDGSLDPIDIQEDNIIGVCVFPIAGVLSFLRTEDSVLVLCLAHDRPPVQVSLLPKDATRIANLLETGSRPPNWITARFARARYIAGPWPNLHGSVKGSLVVTCTGILFAGKDGARAFLPTKDIRAATLETRPTSGVKGPILRIRIDAGDVLVDLQTDPGEASLLLEPLLSTPPEIGPTSRPSSRHSPPNPDQMLPPSTAVLEKTDAPWQPLAVIAACLSAGSLLVVDLGIVGVVLGIISLVQLGKTQPTPRGRWLAWTAIGVGALIFVATLSRGAAGA